MDDSELFVLKGITKVYGNGIVANKDVDFSVRRGEIHALIGENGAGKTTLMKILYGIEQPDRGEILLEGRPVVMHSPAVAIGNGLGMVQQHFQLVPSLTVAENLVLGREPRKGIFFDRAQAREICEHYSKQYELPVQPDKYVRDISVSEKQKLEILKALLGGAKILILDEPTAVLTPQEIVEFFQQLRKLRDSGHTIIFISHRLRELMEISDRMSVMRDGRMIGVYNTADCNEHDISRLIVGRDVVLQVEKEKARPAETVLRVKDLVLQNEWGKRVVDNISFSVRAGEIVGIAAIEGNGQKELIDAITGNRPYSQGSIRFEQMEVGGQTIPQLRQNMMGYISEDRNTVGTATAASVQDNLITLVRADKRLYRRGLFRKKALKQYCERMITQYEIKCDGKDTPVSMLSGGNVQKVVIARELDRNPKLLLAQQPTRGVDVGSIEFIHKHLIQNRDGGSAILLVSADLSEVLALSDSLIVIQGGRIQAYFASTEGVSETDIGAYMLGIKAQDPGQIGEAYHEN